MTNSNNPMKTRSTVVVLLLALFFCSCEEDDTSHPIITIHSPAMSQHFDIYDTIKVSADISDNNVITTIKVVLTDSQLLQVLPADYIYPNSATYNVSLNYPIYDKYLETGEYYLLIRSEDGTNFKNEYQNISITGIPLELEQIIVLTDKNTNQMGVSSINQVNQINPLFDIEGDYAASVVDSRYQQLYVAGKNIINLHCYSLQSFVLWWTIETAPPLPMHSENCLIYDEFLYASFDSYYIYGYRYDGSNIFSTTIEEGKRPSKIKKFNDLLLADLQSKTGGNTYIATYYTVSGSEKQRLQTNYEVVEFLNLDEDNVLIAANKYGQGVINSYNPYQNVETQIMEVPGRIQCAVKLSNSNYLISTDEKIYEYIHEYTTITQVLPGTAALRLKFDDLNSMVYTVEPYLIKEIKYPQMTYQSSHLLQDSILDVHLLYNK